jgi:hypothetical protein
MSMYQGHRGMGGVPPANGGAGRLNELLEQIRAEFESNARQTETYDHQSKPSSRRNPRCPSRHASMGGPWPWHRVARSSSRR